MQNPPGEITLLLRKLRSGDQEAEEKLVEAVYAHLRRIAVNLMRQERPDHTLQATALVHEAYLKLIDRGDDTWENRAHFFAAASRVMRHILVDCARSWRAKKRSGALQRVEFEESVVVSKDSTDEILAVDEALQRLERLDFRQSRVVELRYFGGLTVEETATALDIGVRTVKSDWAFARTWLYGELSKGSADGPEQVA